MLVLHLLKAFELSVSQGVDANSQQVQRLLVLQVNRQHVDKHKDARRRETYRKECQ